MVNKVDKAIESLRNKLRGKPVFSGLTTFFGAIAIGEAFLSRPDISGLTMATAVASPAAGAALTGIAVLNLFRERPKLSKVFSAFSAGAGFTGLAAFGYQMTTPEFGPFFAPVFSTLGMTAAGVFNLASHYTKNSEIGGKVEPVNNPDPPAPE